MKTALLSLAFALTATAAAPAFAEAEVPQKVQFTHEGVTYVYTTTKVGESTIYKGYATPGYPFYLVSRKGQVTGKANGTNVSFKTPTVDVQSAAVKQIPLAAR